MQRTLLGLISLGCFAVAGVLYMKETPADTSFAMATSIRVGLITAAWWLAYPSFATMPRWLLVVVALLALVIAVRPRLIPFAFLALVALALLRPRVKRFAEIMAEQQRED